MERHPTAVAQKTRAVKNGRDEGRFASVCSVEKFILKQENRNAAQKPERDVRLLERLLKTKVEDRKMEFIPAVDRSFSDTCQLVNKNRTRAFSMK